MSDSDLELIRFAESKVERKAFTLTISNKMDLSERAAKAHVDVADKTYAVPARQDTIKTCIVATSILVLVAAGIHFVPASEVSGIIKTALIVVGGAWGATEAIKRWRKGV